MAAVSAVVAVAAIVVVVAAVTTVAVVAAGIMAAMHDRNSVVAVNRVTMAVVSSKYTLGVSSASTRGTTTGVGITRVTAAV